jgi:hypothetical protein
MAGTEKSLCDRVREYANKYHMHVSLTPIINEEYEISYYRQTKVFKVPLTKLFANSFETLCIASQKALHYASRFQELTDKTVDFPSHVLPILECYIDDETESIFLRIPFGSCEDKTIANTLHSHVAEGKWISEKILLRWTLQLLTSLFNAHKAYLTFPAFDSKDIFLHSDELILSARKMHSVAMRNRDVREEEEKKRARIASRTSDRPGSDSSQTPNIRATMVKFPPIGRGNVM